MVSTGNGGGVGRVVGLVLVQGRLLRSALASVEIVGQVSASSRFLKRSFKQADEAHHRPEEDEIDERRADQRRGVGVERLRVGRFLEQFRQRHGGGERGVLEHRDAVAGHRRDDHADRLRQHHLAQGQQERQAERLRRLELAVRNAFYAGAEHLGRIGRHDDGERRHRGGPGRQAYAEERQRIVDQDQHHQHRHRPEDVDVADREPPQRLRRIEPHQADHQADRDADADAQDAEQQRVQEAAQQRRQAGHDDIGVEEGVQQRHGSIPEPVGVPRR